jgi:hypothetical protein
MLHGSLHSSCSHPHRFQWLYVLHGSLHMLHGMYHNRVVAQRHDITDRQTSDNRHDSNQVHDTAMFMFYILLREATCSTWHHPDTLHATTTLQYFVKWLTTCMFRPYNTIRHNDYDGSLQLHVPATLQLFHDATHMLNAAWLAPYIYHARSSTQISMAVCSLWLSAYAARHVLPSSSSAATRCYYRQTDNDRHD